MTHWEQARTEAGERITVWTDVPCHLWMRWSLLKPWVHRVGRIRRGLPTLGDYYFCFDVYQDNEQEGPGDAIVHTFLKEPWPYCEKRWFYFHGTIDGKPSPSTSPVFSKHPVAPPAPPPPVLKCACELGRMFDTGIAYNCWSGQPFIFPNPITVRQLDILGSRGREPGNPTMFLRLYKAAESGFPDGPVLWETTFEQEFFPYYHNWDWRTFSIPGFHFDANQPFVFIMGSNDHEIYMYYSILWCGRGFGEPECQMRYIYTINRGDSWFYPTGLEDKHETRLWGDP